MDKHLVFYLHPVHFNHQRILNQTKYELFETSQEKQKKSWFVIT
jgi:hypothetical protein